MNGLRKRIDGQVCPSLCLIAAVVTILLYSSTALAQPVKVLFVKNGWYQQETDIYNHLTDLGSYDITTKKDYQIYGSTDLSIYDLIIITEFAPNISYLGLNNIKNSGKPVLIVEYWDFWYSYKLGLVEDDWAGYYGTDTVEVITPEHPIARRFGDEIEVYSTSYTVYGIPYSDIKDGVTPLIYSSSSFNEVAVLSDKDRKIDQKMVLRCCVSGTCCTAFRGKRGMSGIRFSVPGPEAPVAGPVLTYPLAIHP